MPQRCPPDPLLHAVLGGQDWVIHRAQARALGLSAEAIRYRVRTKQWFRLLPDVYLTHPGEASRRQMLVAALLYAGPDAAIDGADACRFHGIKAITVDDDRVYVVVPDNSSARSTHFVVVRRTLTATEVVSTELLRYVEPATAVVSATRRMHNPRTVLATLSDALQRRVTTYDDLLRAHVQGSPRNSRHTGDALADLGAGTHSVPEADFRRLAVASSVLPRLLYNVWLRLPSGRRLCVDALIASSAVIHETNGRTAHRREDLFEDMQERGDALTAAGFAVLNNPPRRIRLHGREVIAQVERCHQLYEGRGLPPGVELLGGDVMDGSDRG